MNAVIYSRYSTENQREASIEDQERSCERLAAQHGLTIVGRYVDKGISGGTAQRPGYQTLLEAARAAQFEVILSEDISRLWRSASEYAPRAAEFEDLGVNLITCVGDDTRTQGWGMMLLIKQAMAEHYRKEVSYRTKRGLEGRALAGKPTGSRKYGYRSGVIYEPEAAIVRRIFALRQGGMMQQGIANTLNGEGVPSPLGARWSENNVGRLLRADRYQGRVVYGKTTVKRSAADSKNVKLVTRTPLVDRYDPSMQIVSQES